jgi:hypothetical protein
MQKDEIKLGRIVKGRKIIGRNKIRTKKKLGRIVKGRKIIGRNKIRTK